MGFEPVLLPPMFFIGQLQTNASKGLLNVSHTNCSFDNYVGPHSKGVCVTNVIYNQSKWNW